MALTDDTGAGKKTAAKPQGGRVTEYTDPNGYRWVDDGTPNGYWWRPEDGKVYRSTLLTRVTAPPPPARSGGGRSVFGGLGGVLSDVGGAIVDVAEDIGPPAMTALRAPYEYVGAPAFGVLSGLTEAERRPIYDEAGNVTGYYRDPGLGGILDIPKAVADFARHPVREYEEARRATEEYFANPAHSEVENIVGQGAIDPLSHIAPGAVTRVAGNVLPRAITSPVAWVLEAPRVPTAAGIAGAGLAAQFGESIPGFRDIPEQLQPVVGGGIAGGVAGLAGGVRSTARQATRTIPQAAPDISALQRGPIIRPGPIPGSYWEGNVLRQAYPPGLPPSVRQPTPGQQVRDILSPEGTRLPQPEPPDVPVRAAEPPPPPAAAAPPAPATTPVAPRTRTVPTGAAVANTKTPPTGTKYDVVPTKRTRRNQFLEVAVKVDGQDAGVIRRAADGKWEAYYRNPNGDLVRPPMNTAGDVTTYTKRQAQNVVVNGYLARGRVLEDVPVKPRAPRAPRAPRQEPVQPAAGAATPAAEGAVSPGPGATTGVAPSAPAMSLEEALVRSVEEARARRPDVPGATGKRPPRRPVPVPDYEKGREASRAARSPFRTGQTVMYKDQAYEVVGFSTQTRQLSVRHLDGTIPKGGPHIPWDEAEAIVVPPSQLPIRSMVRELDERIPADLRTRIYRDEAAWEKRMLAGRPVTPEQEAAVRSMRQVLEDAVLDARMRDNPEVQRIADELVADAPKDMAVPGSESHARRLAVETGTATPAQEAIHEAEVRAAMAEMAAPVEFISEPLLPSTILKGVAGDIAESAEKQRPPRFVNRAGRAGAQAAFYPFRALRDFKLAGDMVLGRQLWPALLGDTGRASRSAARGIKAMFSSPAARRRLWDESEAFLEANPWAHSILKRGDRPKLGEELFLTNLAGKLPFLKQVEEANALILNSYRMSWMLHQLKLAADAGVDVTDPTFLRSLDEVAGALSGRGYGEFLDQNARWLNATLFISSRYTASRFQFWGLFLPSSVGGSRAGRAFGLAVEHPWVAAQARRRVARAAATAAASMAALAMLPGVEMVTDPTSSRFGQFRWRGNWYDFLGGLHDPVRLGAQIGFNRVTSERGFQRQLSDATNLPQRVFESAIRGVANYIEARVPPGSRLILETAGYVSPFQEEPIGNLPGWAQHYLPISVGQYANYWAELHSSADVFWAATNTALTFGGFNVREQSKVTTWEQEAVDKLIRAGLGDNPAFKIHDDQPLTVENMSRTGWLFVESNPGTFGKKPDLAFGETKERNDRIAQIKENFRKNQEIDDAKASGIDASMSREEWRIRRSARKQDLVAALEAEYGDFRNDPDSPDVVKRWYAYIDATKVNGVPDWDAVEEWELRLSPAERRELETYLDLKREEGTAMERQYALEMDRISDAGYWEGREIAFDEWKVSDEFASQFDSYEDWRDAWIRQETERILAENPGMAVNVARNDAYGKFNAMNNRSMGFNEAYKATRLYDWVEQHPYEAQLVEEWEFRKWDKAARAIIYDNDPSQANEEEQQYRVKRAVTTTVITTSAGRGPFEEWETRAWQQFATQNNLRTPDGRSAAQFSDPAAFRAAGGSTDDWSGAISKAEYERRPSAYIRVRVGTNKDGSPQYKYLNPAAKAQVEAIAALWRQNPDAVREAFRLGLPGFDVGDDISEAEAIWLRSQGVQVPEE